LATGVDKTCWSPIEESLKTEFVFRWTSVAGKGNISFFELDQPVVPRYLGVLVPEAVTSFDKVHIFFHPTPGQAGHKDADYRFLGGNWAHIFRYLSSEMGAQFCAARTDRVLFMPLMTGGSAANCGIFPQQWESIVGRVLGMLKSGDMSAAAQPAHISSVVISSFSSGIIYSHHFRSRAGLGARLAGVIDFDGVISSYRQYSSMIASPAARVIRMQQIPAEISKIRPVAAQNIFPLARARWGGPYTFSGNDYQVLMQIHGTIPLTMMFIAAKQAG
jgi:hypothetical protein